MEAFSKEDLASLDRLNLLRRRAATSPAVESSTEQDALEERFESRFETGSRLAVYGSLAPGRPNHHQVAELGGTWISGLTTRGKFLSEGWGDQLGYPALSWAWEGGPVAVELFISNALAQHWPRLDRFEGLDYLRILVPLFREESDDSRRVVEVANLYEAATVEPPAAEVYALHVRYASVEDFEALAALAGQTFRDAFGAENVSANMDAYVENSFSPERVEAELADQRNTFLLAVADLTDPPVGYAKLRRGPPDPSVGGAEPVELERLYVHRGAIGQGVGARLMRACLNEAARTGRKTLWLGVWERNGRAIDFYRRWGFEKVGEHVFLLGKDPQNDFIMERPVPG